MRINFQRAYEDWTHLNYYDMYDENCDVRFHEIRMICLQNLFN